MNEDRQHLEPDLQTHGGERRGKEDNGNVPEEEEKEEAETNDVKQEEESKHHSISVKHKKKNHKKKNRKLKEVTVIKTDPSPSSGKPSLDHKALLEDLCGSLRRLSVGTSSSPRAGRNGSTRDSVENSKTSSELHSRSKSHDRMTKDPKQDKTSKSSEDAAVKDRSAHGRSRSKDGQRSCSPDGSKENVHVIPQPAGEQSGQAAAPKSQTTIQARREQDTAESVQEELLSWVKPLEGDSRHKPANENDDRDEVEVGGITVYHRDTWRHGTFGGIVFRGEFNRRSMAVKRIPLDESRCTDQEVDLMREADDQHHPNIVRLFVSTKDHQFHYIAFSSSDATLIEYLARYDHQNFQSDLEPVMALQQIIEGLDHLHSLKIVHNAIEHRTLLVSTPDSSGQRRLMISGFEKAQKVPVGSELELRYKDDIMGAGKAFGLVASPGPICSVEADPSRGEDTFIMSSTLNKGHLYDDLAMMHVASKMKSIEVRTHSLKELLKLPFFWKSEKVLDFFQEVSDRLQMELLDGPIMTRLERGQQDVVEGDWLQHITEPLHTYLLQGNRAKYDGRQVKGLLRVIRNLKHHYWELPDEVQETLGFPPDDFVSYFTSRFPFLLMHTYEAMSTCAHERPFQPYYPRDYRCTKYPVTEMTEEDFEDIYF